MNRAVIYARYSSTGQTEQSIEGQLRDCYRAAEEAGLTVVKEYIDRALTGKNDNRPQFRKMINDSAYGTFDTVITWKMDRFARNRTDSALYKKILKDNGVKVIYAAENIPEGNEGVILESVLEGLAEYYSLDLAQKTIRGKKESIRKGKYAGGKVLYGYYIDENKYYVIDETIAPIVRKIFNDYISGVRAFDISNNLNLAGIKTKVGDTWTSKKVTKVIRNRKYTGYYECFDVKSEEQIPAIIDNETFEMAQRMLVKNQTGGGKNKAKHKYLLSGKIKCGECKSAMCGNSTGVSKKNSTLRCYYTCNNYREKKGCNARSVRRDYIEKIVLDNTIKIILKDDFINNIADKIIELNEIEDNSADLISVYESELKDTTVKINNIMTAIEEGVASPRMINRIAELEKREQEIKEQIKMERLKICNNALSKEQIVRWLTMFKDGDINSEDFCNKLIKLFIDKIFVYHDKVVINYNYLDKAHQQSVHFFKPDTLHTGTLLHIRVAKCKTLHISRNSFYLEVMRP